MFHHIQQFIACYTIKHQQFSTNQSTPLSISYPTNEYQSTVHHNVYSQQPSIPQLEYVPTTYQQQQPDFSQSDSSLVVPVFQKGDDPIDAINHMMSFLTAVVTSRYPTTNNQLRTSSNPRQQATIYDGKVTVQPVQGRQTYFMMLENNKKFHTWCKYLLATGGWKQRTVICYNCKGEGHIAKQCTKPKRKRDDTWFNDKGLPAVNQSSLVSHYPQCLLIKADDLDALRLGLVMNSFQAKIALHWLSLRNAQMPLAESETDIISDSNIIPYSQYLSETQQETVQNSNSSAQQDVLILS
ncbi:retrovirus-related pol polyprotein from transposon TNT 1-94 [Tanacetum coccineum]